MHRNFVCGGGGVDQHADEVLRNHPLDKHQQDGMHLGIDDTWHVPLQPVEAYRRFAQDVG